MPSFRRKITIGPVDPQRSSLLRRNDLHAETPRLRHGPPREVSAREARRKAEVVLNSRAQSRLPSRRFPSPP